MQRENESYRTEEKKSCAGTVVGRALQGKQTKKGLRKRLKKRVNNILRVCWVCTAIGVELELRLLTKKEKVLQTGKRSTEPELSTGINRRQPNGA